jgi:hypothetical protein|tara:strand:- start:321 stop:626 length:306 start_codon:yes stop_codon:yes gene_type:complete
VKLVHIDVELDVVAFAKQFGVRHAVQHVQRQKRYDDSANQRASSLCVQVTTNITANQHERRDVEAVNHVHEHLSRFVADFVKRFHEMPGAYQGDEDHLRHV